MCAGAAERKACVSITDAVVATFAATLFLAAIVFYVAKGIRAVWKLGNRILVAVDVLGARLAHAADVADKVGAELAYVRQVTQAQPGVVQEEVQPPVGRRSQMPPAFPERPYFDPGPPAKPEDTPVSLATETDEDVMAAQDREERRAHGIEPDDDEVPRDAVREDA